MLGHLLAFFRPAWLAPQSGRSSHFKSPPESTLTNPRLGFLLRTLGSPMVGMSELRHKWVEESSFNNAGLCLNHNKPKERLQGCGLY